MRILQICPKPPRPKIDGGCIAMDAMSEGLAGLGHNVKVFALATQKHPIMADSICDDYVRDYQFESFGISTSINPISALFHLATNRSYNASRFYSRDVAERLKERLEEKEFDLIILESIYACNYTDIIKESSKAKIVLRAHNVEFEIWRELARQSGFLKGWYVNKLSSQLEKFELEESQKVDGIVTITKDDAKWFEDNTKAPVHVCPFSVDLSRVNPREKVDHVFHFGSMDWLPNQEGVRWLIHEVWPIVRAEHKNAKLVLAGRNMPSEFESNPDMGIEVKGEVESAEEFLSRNGIATVPVLSGSGMRVKAVEAMSMGLPVVGTSLGMVGTEVENGVHALIEDSTDGFAYAICKLLDSQSLTLEIAENGQRHVENCFNKTNTFKQLDSFLQKIS